MPTADTYGYEVGRSRLPSAGIGPRRIRLRAARLGPDRVAARRLRLAQRSPRQTPRRGRAVGAGGADRHRRSPNRSHPPIALSRAPGVTRGRRRGDRVHRHEPPPRRPVRDLQRSLDGLHPIRQPPRPSAQPDRRRTDQPGQMDGRDRSRGRDRRARSRSASAKSPPKPPKPAASPRPPPASSSSSTTSRRPRRSSPSSSTGSRPESSNSAAPSIHSSPPASSESAPTSSSRDHPGNNAGRSHRRRDRHRRPRSRCCRDQENSGTCQPAGGRAERLAMATSR